MLEDNLSKEGMLMFTQNVPSFNTDMRVDDTISRCVLCLGRNVYVHG